MIHQLLHTWCFLPQVMLVICQPHRQQHAGTELQEALVKLLSHKIEPAGKVVHTFILKNKTKHKFLWMCAVRSEGLKENWLWVRRIPQTQHSTVQPTQRASRQRLPKDEPPEVLWTKKTEKQKQAGSNIYSCMGFLILIGHPKKLEYCSVTVCFLLPSYCLEGLLVPWWHTQKQPETLRSSWPVWWEETHRRTQTTQINRKRGRGTEVHLDLVLLV